MKKRMTLLLVFLMLLSFVSYAHAGEAVGFSMKNIVRVEKLKKLKNNNPQLFRTAKKKRARHDQLSTWECKLRESIADSPKLNHYVWETKRPPHGQFDKIALHRVVMKSKNRRFCEGKKTILMLPGTWDACGWSKLTDANINSMIYLANKGYDVFTVSFRNFYLPNLTYEQFQAFGIDVSPTLGWTYEVYREDIKACVDRIKAMTGAQKIFMSGFSRGTMLMYIYASKYQKDLKGLITLDGWIKKDAPNTTQAVDEGTFNFIINNLLGTGNLPVPDNCEGSHCGPAGTMYQLLHEAAYDYYDDWQLAAVVPNAQNLVGQPLPSDFKVISEFVAVDAHSKWGGEGLFVNYYGGYSNLDDLIIALADMTRYWPTVQDFETWQMNAYNDVPYFDYDDNEIDLPAIGFLTDLFCPDGTCLDETIPNRTVNNDVTIKYLPGYGHFDIMLGNDAVLEVKEPLLQWLDDHI